MDFPGAESVPLPRPFSITLAMAHLRASSFGVPYKFLGPSRLRRALMIAGQSVVVDLDFVEGKASAPGCLRVTPVGGTSSRETKAQPVEALRNIVGLARFVFGMDDSLADCYAALASEPVIVPLLGRYRGLRVVRAPNLYEALLVAIMGQQVSVASAQAHRRSLMAGLGQVVEVDSESYYSFPSPPRLAEASAERLRELGISRQKARYLVEVARRAADGKLDAAALASLPDEEVMERLMDIPGVGRWTAEVVLLRGLGRLDVFPAADLGLQVAAERALGLDSRPSEAELRQLAERWAGWRSYAAFYLWMTLMEGGYA